MTESLYKIPTYSPSTVSTNVAIMLPPSPYSVRVPFRVVPNTLPLLAIVSLESATAEPCETL